MDVRYEEIALIRKVREGKLPLSQLDALLNRAREEYPRPGELLLAIVNSAKTTESAKLAVSELLEICWNLIEFHSMLRLEEAEHDEAHVAHAKEQLGVWVDKLSDALGPQPDTEGVEKFEADEEAEGALRKAAAEEADEEAKGVDDADLATPQEIPLGLLEGLLSDDEAAAARVIARATGRLPGVELTRGADGALEAARASFALPSDPSVTRWVSAPRGDLAPILAALNAIVRYVTTPPGEVG